MKTTQTIAMLGAGSWGSALALVLADNGHQVRLWSHSSDQVKEINHKRTNQKYIPNVSIPQLVTAFESLEETIRGVETIILAVPSKAFREVLSNLTSILRQSYTFIHVSKGIEPGTHLRLSEIIEEEIPQEFRKAVVVLSGPSHAEEVILRLPTTVSVSSKNEEASNYVQDLFMNETLRVYTNPDLIGVELGGALKNIIALGAGVSDGLGFGDNSKAALITRGLSEIVRLGTKMGADARTFYGLSGVGDLIVTCTSVHSRNWRTGNRLGKGESLETILSEMGMAVEGIRTTEAAYQLAQKYQVDMPITNVLYKILFEKVKASDAARQLMIREKTNEGLGK